MYKERHGSVTAWLVIWIVWNVLGIIMNFTGSGISALFGGNKSNYTAFGIIGIVNIICYILIFCWKFIGVIGKVITSVIDLILNIIEMGKIGHAFDSGFSGIYGQDMGFSGAFKWAGVFRFVIFLLLFFSVLCKRYNGQPSTWDYLLGYLPEKSKPKADSSRQDALICKSCNKIFSAGYSSCPYCSSKNIESNPNSTNENVEIQNQFIPPIRSTSNEVTKRCKKCGEKVNDDIFKCPKCKGEPFI